MKENSSAFFGLAPSISSQMDQMAELSIHSILYLFFQYWDPIPNDKDPSFKFSVIVNLNRKSRIKYREHKSSVANYSVKIGIWQHCKIK